MCQVHACDGQPAGAAARALGRCSTSGCSFAGRDTCTCRKTGERAKHASSNVIGGIATCDVLNVANGFGCGGDHMVGMGSHAVMPCARAACNSCASNAAAMLLCDQLACLTGFGVQPLGCCSVLFCSLSHCASRSAAQSNLSSADSVCPRLPSGGGGY